MSKIRFSISVLSILTLLFIYFGCKPISQETSNKPVAEKNLDSQNQTPCQKIIYSLDEENGGFSLVIFDPCKEKSLSLTETDASKGKMLLIGWRNQNEYDANYQFLLRTQDLLKNAGYDVDILMNPKVSDIKAAAESGQYDVVHFDGHGWKGTYQVYDENGSRPVGKQELTDIFTNNNQNTVITTNACYTNGETHIQGGPNDALAYNGQVQMAYRSLVKEGIENPTLGDLHDRIVQNVQSMSETNIGKLERGETGVFPDGKPIDFGKLIRDTSSNEYKEEVTQLTRTLQTSEDPAERKAAVDRLREINDAKGFAPPRPADSDRLLFAGKKSDQAVGGDVPGPSPLTRISGQQQTSPVYNEIKQQISSGELKPVGEPDASGFQAYRNEKKDSWAFYNKQTEEYQAYDKSSANSLQDKDGTKKVWYNKELGDPYGEAKGGFAQIVDSKGNLSAVGSPYGEEKFGENKTYIMELKKNQDGTASIKDCASESVQGYYKSLKETNGNIQKEIDKNNEKLKDLNPESPEAKAINEQTKTYNSQIQKNDTLREDMKKLCGTAVNLVQFSLTDCPLDEVDRQDLEETDDDDEDGTGKGIVTDPAPTEETFPNETDEDEN